jgi:hypothetical protein
MHIHAPEDHNIHVSTIGNGKFSANILNKQLRTTDRDGPPAWGLDEGLTTPRRKKKLRNVTRRLGIDGLS